MERFWYPFTATTIIARKLAPLLLFTLGIGLLLLAGREYFLWLQPCAVWPAAALGALAWLAAGEGPERVAETAIPVPDEAERAILQHSPIYSAGTWVEPEAPVSSWKLQSPPSRRYSLLSLVPPAEKSREPRPDTVAPAAPPPPQSLSSLPSLHSSDCPSQ